MLLLTLYPVRKTLLLNKLSGKLVVCIKVLYEFSLLLNCVMLTLEKMYM